MRWRCQACGCLYTAGAPCCPDCRATVHDDEAAPAAGEEDEMAKISRLSVVSTGSVTSVHASVILPDGAQVHRGLGEVPQSTEHPAGGTMSPPVANDAAEQAPKTPSSPAPKAAAKPAPAPAPPPPAPPAKPSAKATPPPATPPKKASP